MSDEREEVKNGENSEKESKKVPPKTENKILNKNMSQLGISIHLLLDRISIYMRIE